MPNLPEEKREKPETARHRGRRRILLAGAAMVFACGAGLLAAFFAGGPHGDMPPIAPTVSAWAALPDDAPLTYQITELRMGSPRTDRKLDIRPTAINNRGQIVGSVERIGYFAPLWWRNLAGGRLAPFIRSVPVTETAFFWDAGRTQTLSGLNGAKTNASAYDINDSGQIVGNATIRLAHNNGTIEHAVLWTNFRAVPQDLTASLGGSVSSNAFGINALGQVAVNVGGTFQTAQTYLWDGSLHRAGSAAQAYRINDNGESVGVLQKKGNDTPAVFSPGKPPLVLTNFGQRKVPQIPILINNRRQIPSWDNKGPFLYENGHFQRLVVLPTNLFWGNISGLNENGEVVGDCRPNPKPATGTNKGDTLVFLWRKNRLYDVNDLLGPSPHWRIEGVYALNDRGQIVCGATPTDPSRRIPQSSGPFYQHILLLTPVLPAPRTSEKTQH